MNEDLTELYKELKLIPNIAIPKLWLREDALPSEDLEFRRLAKYQAELQGLEVKLTSGLQLVAMTLAVNLAQKSAHEQKIQDIQPELIEIGQEQTSLSQVINKTNLTLSSLSQKRGSCSEQINLLKTGGRNANKTFEALLHSLNVAERTRVNIIRATPSKRTQHENKQALNRITQQTDEVVAQLKQAQQELSTTNMLIARLGGQTTPFLNTQHTHQEALTNDLAKVYTSYVHTHIIHILACPICLILFPRLFVVV